MHVRKVVDGLHLVQREIDMLHGSLWDKIIIFALPLALTGVFQQLFNAADVVTLGKFVDKNAMAAVGNNISLIGLFVNLFMGLSLGGNVVIARFIGAKRPDRANVAVQTAFLLALFTGIGVMVLGEAFTGLIMEWMQVPDAVRGMSEAYLRIYLLAMPVIGLYNFEAAIFRARGDTQTPLISLIIASVLNIALNLLFVLVFDWGVPGVAAATDIANVTAAGYLLRGLMKTEGVIHIDPGHLTLDRSTLKEMVRIGLPAGIQGMVFSLANLVIQSAINSLGPDAMAGSAAGFTIEINVYCVVGAFAQAATTFVSQNYGARKMIRCRMVIRYCLFLNALVTGVMSIIIVGSAEPLMAFFSSDPNVIHDGVIRLYYIVGPEIICVIYEVLASALRGYGISMAPAILTLVAVCGVRLIWVFTLFQAVPTYECLMACYPASWIVNDIFMIGAYFFYRNQIKVMRSFDAA